MYKFSIENVKQPLGEQGINATINKYDTRVWSVVNWLCISSICEHGNDNLHVLNNYGSINSQERCAPWNHAVT